MRKNVEKVLLAFAGGKAQSGDTCSTDGEFLFSYRMKIAHMMPDHTIRLIEYNQAPSNTTRSHIKACETYFDKGGLVRIHDESDL